MLVLGLALLMGRPFAFLNGTADMSARQLEARRSSPGQSNGTQENSGDARKQRELNNEIYLEARACGRRGFVNRIGTFFAGVRLRKLRLLALTADWLSQGLAAQPGTTLSRQASTFRSRR